MGKSSCCSKDSGLNKGAWTAQEDFILSNFLSTHGEGQWRSLPRKAGLKRCGKSCRLRWLNYLRPDIKRGNISPDEKDLIIRLHGLLGNRWSLIAGRLPGRTDNEIKNYWNTHLSKSRITEKGADYKPHTKSKLGSHDGLTCTPLKATAVRITKGQNQNGNSHHEEVRSMDVGQSMKSSKSWHEILGEDFIMEEDTSGSEENDGNEGNMPDTLQYLKKLTYPDHDLNFCPFDYSRDMTMEDIVSNGYEEKSFRVADDRTMGEISSITEHLGDWVLELESQGMNRTGMPSFTTLLLECEHDWGREEAGILL